MKIQIISRKQDFSFVPYENKTKKYVSFGKDNLYPQKLIELKNNSGLHNEILNKKIMMGVGEGFFSEKLKELPMANEYETLNDVLFKCYSDLETFGGFYLQPIYSKSNLAPKLYHIPYQNIRSGKKNNKGLIDNFYYSEEWKPYMNSKSIKELKSWKPRLSSSIYSAKKYNVGQLYYSLPSYNAAVLDVETLSEISKYHNANLHNNFQPGALFILKPGAGVSDEDLEQQIADIQDNIGTSSTGELIIYVQDERGETPEFKQFETNDIDKQFDILANSTKENIIISHEIPRVLTGIREPGALGGSAKELAEANLMFYNEYVIKNQTFILSHFNKLLGLDLQIKNTIVNPYLYDKDVLMNNLTINEIREIIDYGEIEGGDTISTKNNDKKNEK